MADRLKHRHYWIFSVAALAVWLAVGWPNLLAVASGAMLRGAAVPPLWLVPFVMFGVALGGTTVSRIPTRLRWILLCTELAAVLAMAILAPRSTFSILLVVIAWQVALETSTSKALGWVAAQTLAIVGVLALTSNSGLSSGVGLSFVLQLFFVFTARALRIEAEAARALTVTNGDLRSAQESIASNVRDSERLRISRELHDAWGHALAAIGLQLEIAGHVSEPSRVKQHVLRARGLSSALLTKVREVVAGMRESAHLDDSDGSEGVRAALGHGAEPGRLSDAVPFPVLRRKQPYWFFSVAALAVCLALGWPVFQQLTAGAAIRGTPVSALWLIPFATFAAAACTAMFPKLPSGFRWWLLAIQVAAVLAMAAIVQWAMMSAFLIITAWQVALVTPPAKALAWVALQTLAVVGALGLVPNPDICWVIIQSFGLQLSFVFAAQALRREAETTRSLTETHVELRSAQTFLATTARDAERLRISRELHDAWGHELTALGLQLEIASHIADPGRANQHLKEAKELASGLMARVRDVVASLRSPECCDLQDALKELARSVPKPSVHIEISPGLRVSPDQAHALMRCAQEAVTNAVRHAQASNLWLGISADGDGVRLIARDDGMGRPTSSSTGSGLLGMRERVEFLGGRLAVMAGTGLGFTVDAWLPWPEPQAA